VRECGRVGQLFVVGPPRSGLTLVTQFLNHHQDIRIFDEIDLIQVGKYGQSVIGTLQAFLLDRGVYDVYRRYTEETAEPAVALRAVMSDIAQPCTIWGEKNPRYATRLEALRQSFPEAVVLFVLRDPREVVNSCLLHRDSPMRGPLDFWIADTVAEALALVQGCLEPLEAADLELVVLRYEAFTARPKESLDAALGRWGLTFSESAVPLAHPAPETVGDHQFFRDGTPLPWKVGNLSPLRQPPIGKDRVDAGDPFWSQVDALAQRFGYG
jgi:Sulfotransferase family